MKLKKITEIKSAIVGVEMSLGVLRDDLEFVKGRLSFLNKIEEDLVYNINFLKRPDITSVIGEYKRSIVELNSVREEISTQSNLKNKLIKKIDKATENLNYYMDELKHIYDEIEQEKVVLLFKKES